MNNNFDKFELIDLYKAYYDCRRHKRNTKSALEFESNLEQNIINLYEDLKTKKYKIGKSICSISIKPKAREIFAANFRDRIVHHLIYIKLEKIFGNGFIFDSAASQKNKGVFFARNRLYKHMQKSSKNFSRQVFYLQMDIKSFFMSIDKNILENLISKKLKAGFYKDLTLHILWHNPINDFEYRGDKKLYTKLKKPKSLFFVSKDKGLAIGNLTSQFFANIYLHELDNFVKRELKCKYYTRYVDDFVLLSTDKKELKIWKQKIKSFVNSKLDIEVHPNKIVIQRIDQGIKYLGAVIKTHCIYTSNRTYGNFEKILYKMAYNKDSKIDKQKTLSQLNSYMGFFKQTKYKKRFISIYNKYYKELNLYFFLDLNRMCFVLRE